MYLVLLMALINYSMSNNIDLTFLTDNVRGIQQSKKIKSLINYFKSKLNHNGVFFYKKNILLLKMKMYVLTVLTFQYFFLMVQLTHAVF